MKLTRGLLAFALSSSLVLPVTLTTRYYAVVAQDAKAAVQRGYRTGYSDGYMAGYRDSIDSLERSISRHREYETADRAYSGEYGSLDDYRFGYRKGFENGYVTGFEKRTFESTVPTDLTGGGRRTTSTSGSDQRAETKTELPTVSSNREIEKSAPEVADQKTQDQPTQDEIGKTATTRTDEIADEQKPLIRKTSFRGDDAIILIPKDTEILLEMEEVLDTGSVQAGERFTARVLSPIELDGAIIEGHVEKLQQPGRIKRPAELQLVFDRIVLNETRWSNFSGLLLEVMPIKGDNISRVTDEGTLIGQSSAKGDVIKIGGATGTGAGVGAIVGGPVGAAVGAGIGAAIGIGAAVTDRGKQIRINKDQQIKVRTSYETRIR